MNEFRCHVRKEDIELPQGSLAHYASRYGWIDVVFNLFDLGLGVDDVDKNGDTCLSIACQWNQEELALKLLEKGARIDVKNRNGNTAFHCACIRGVFQVIKMISHDKKFDFSLLNAQNQTVLHCCFLNKQEISEQYEKLLPSVLDQGLAYVNVQDNLGNTPLHYACTVQGELSLNVIGLLISRGSDPFIKNNKGLDVILSAFHPLRLDVLNKFIQLNIPLSTPPPRCDFYTILEHAADKNPDVAINLIRDIVPRDGCLRNGWTYLHHACDRNDVRVVSLLLNADFDLFARDPTGVTPIHISAGYLRTLHLMVQHCLAKDLIFDTSIRDSAQKAPLHYLANR